MSKVVLPNRLTKKSEGARAVALGPHGYLASMLRQRLGLGNVTATVAACASSLTALHQARQTLRQEFDGRRRRMLVVTSEAALLPVIIHSYERLGVLPPLTSGPGGYCGRPLDARRNGFMLAELGAAVLLEIQPSYELAPHGASGGGDIELLDTAIATEAFDIIRSPQKMPALRRVTQRLLAGRKINVLHPHATGTAENDEAELRVYEEVLADGGLKLTDVGMYASKGALGHGLGAAGLVSLVIACLCAKTGRVPPMPWRHQPITPGASLLPSAIPQPPSAIPCHAIFAAGFGGHVAGAVIQRVT